MIAADPSVFYQKLKSGKITDLEKGILSLLSITHFDEIQMLKSKLNKFFYKLR
jgi:hypothetical protein